MAAQGVLEVPVEARQRLPEDVLHEIQARAHLVGDGGAGGPRAAGEPERGDLAADDAHVLLALAREDIGAVQGVQRLADAPELGEHRAPLGLGGMRGEHQLDGEAVQERAHRRFPHAARLETSHRFRHALGRGCRILRAFPVAERGHALRLLGQVDEVEIEREGGGHAPRGQGRQRRHLGGESLRRVRHPRAPVLGARADALLHREEGRAFLLGEHLAEEGAEEMDARREVHAAACRSPHTPWQSRGRGDA